MSETCPECGDDFENKRGVAAHRHQKHAESLPWRDESMLKELYHNQNMSINEVADELDVTYTAVRKSMQRHGIERRSRIDGIRLAELRKPAPFRTVPKGYERWSVSIDGERVHLYHHQLLAIAIGADPHEVFGDDSVVHHKINIPWLNTPWNIQVLENRGKHRRVHSNDSGARQAQRDAEAGR